MTAPTGGVAAAGSPAPTSALASGASYVALGESFSAQSGSPTITRSLVSEHRGPIPPWWPESSIGWWPTFPVREPVPPTFSLSGNLERPARRWKKSAPDASGGDHSYRTRRPGCRPIPVHRGAVGLSGGQCRRPPPQLSIAARHDRSCPRTRRHPGRPEPDRLPVMAPSSSPGRPGARPRLPGCPFGPSLSCRSLPGGVRHRVVSVDPLAAQRCLGADAGAAHDPVVDLYGPSFGSPAVRTGSRRLPPPRCSPAIPLVSGRCHGHGGGQSRGPSPRSTATPNGFSHSSASRRSGRGAAPEGQGTASGQISGHGSLFSDLIRWP